MQITYIKEPGFIYDLLFIYYFYFNQEESFKRFVTDTRRSEDTAFFKQMLGIFPEPPPELYPLFRFDDHGNTLITTHFYSCFLEQFFVGEGLDFFYEQLTTEGALKRALLATYFECNLHGKKLYSLPPFELLVAASKLSLEDDIKRDLLIALAAPEELAKRAVAFFKEVIPLLQKYYSEHSKRIQELFDCYTTEKIASLYTTLWGAKYNWQNRPAVLSISMLACHVLRFEHINQGMGYIIGQFAENYANNTALKCQEVNLAMIGKAIGDKNRTIIWNLLITHLELSTTEIAERLQLPLSSCFYHLDIMQQSRVLSSRSEGKTVFYRINVEFVRLWQQRINNDITKLEGLS